MILRGRSRLFVVESITLKSRVTAFTINCLIVFAANFYNKVSIFAFTSRLYLQQTYTALQSGMDAILPKK